MLDPASDRDLRIRLAAFEWLREQADLYDGVLPWTVLSKGFEFEGARVPLASMQGIFKPKVISDRITMTWPETAACCGTRTGATTRGTATTVGCASPWSGGEVCARVARADRRRRPGAQDVHRADRGLGPCATRRRIDGGRAATP